MTIFTASNTSVPNTTLSGVLWNTDIVFLRHTCFLMYWLLENAVMDMTYAKDNSITPASFLVVIPGVIDICMLSIFSTYSTF